MPRTKYEQRRRRTIALESTTDGYLRDLAERRFGGIVSDAITHIVGQYQAAQGRKRRAGEKRTNRARMARAGAIYGSGE